MATVQAQTPAPAAPQPASAPALASASSLPTALTIGWLLAELESELASGGGEGHNAGGSLLARSPTPEMRVRQIQTKLFLLQPDFLKAGVDREDTDGVNDALKQLATSVDAALVQKVRDDVLANLTATSTRMGRAFGLGYDLASTCMLPADNRQEQALATLLGGRVVPVHEALADLSSSLPAHAARGVSMSLALWQYWAVNPTLDKQSVRFPQPGISDALARQGQVWRAVLSGEKRGTDMLAAEDYVGALKALARRLVLGRPWVWVILFLLVALTGLGIYLLVAEKATATKIVGIALSALGAVGIRTATLKQGFADVAKDIEAEVWGAEVDFAVAQAITVPPGDWRVDLNQINPPPPRGLDPHIAVNSRTVHRIATAISKRRPWRWRLVKHLHDRCAYQPLDSSKPTVDGSGTWGRLRVARALAADRTLGAEPEIRPGAPERLASHHRDAKRATEVAAVWTFRHGRLVDIQEFADFGEAQDASRQPK